MPPPTYDELGLWLTFLAIAAATTLPRASFIVLGGRVGLPPAIQRALRYAPAAALAAVVAPDLVVADGLIAPFNPRAGAALVVLLVAARWRNPWLPFAAGMGALHLLRLVTT